MEPFIDGGLIEIAIGLGLISLLNFIFFRKQLLIVYSAIAVLSPVFLCLFRKGILFYCVAAFVFLNSVAFVILMWQSRKKSPGKKLLEFKKQEDNFH